MSVFTQFKHNSFSIQASLSKATISVNAAGNVNADESNNSLNLNYSIKFNADISGIDDNLPTTVDEAVGLIKKIPSLIKRENGGRGKALAFVLVPIPILDSYIQGIVAIDRLVTNLESELLDNISHIFSEIHEAKIKLNDIKVLFDQNEYCIPSDKRDALKKQKGQIERKESSMRQQIAQTVKKVRSGELEMSELEDIYQDFKDDTILLRVDQFIDGLRHTIERVRFIVGARTEGAVYIGSNTSFDAERQKLCQNGDYYVLLYCTAKNDEKCRPTKDLFYSLLREGDVTCFMVDLDTRPDLVQSMGWPNELRICHYMNNREVDPDVYDTFEKERKHNIMQSVCDMIHCNYKPNKRVAFQLICPGSIGGGKCSQSKRYWLCAKCKSLVEYGFDGMFYCNCGKERCESYEYKCNDPKHGRDFVGFAPEILASSLETVRLLPVINILVS